jgi:hypothetical protein
MPEPRHSYADDAQDSRRGDEQAEDDEKHVHQARRPGRESVADVCRITPLVSVRFCTPPFLRLEGS